MNKRLLCLLLSVVMLLSVLLTGCGKKTDDKKLGDIAEDAAKGTTTLSLYLMSEKEVSAEQEAKMEEAVNLITKSKFKTQIDLRYYTPEKYYEALEGAMQKTTDAKEAAKEAEAQLKEDIKNGLATSAPKTEAPASTAEQTIINSLGIPELAYPTVDENHVDIFYVGTLDKINSLIEKNWITTLDDDLANDSKIISDYIAEVYLKYLDKIAMGTYMIPSNNPVGEYTYMLLNKEMLEKYNYASTSGFNALTSDNVKDLLSKVATYDSAEYLPLYSGTGELDILDFSYYGVDSNGIVTYDFSVMGGTTLPEWSYLTPDNYYRFRNVFENATFKEKVTVLTEYRLNGYYGTEADAEKPFAVGYVKGTPDIAEVYGEDYEIVVLDTPKMSTDELFSDGFAVSTFSKEVSRCMEIVAYINTNIEFRNLLLYGIEEYNYTIVEKEVDGVIYKTAQRLNDEYIMDVKKTGNVVIAYPTVDELPNIREYQKEQNRDIAPKLDLGFLLEKDDPKDKLFCRVTTLEELDEETLNQQIAKKVKSMQRKPDYANVAVEELEAIALEEIKVSIAEGVVKEANDDSNYINTVAMGKVAELSAQLKAEMLAVESLEELAEFFEYAENKVANDRNYKIMTNILYNSSYANKQEPEYSYNADEYGVGAGFAYIYKSWLDMNKLWTE